MRLWHIYIFLYSFFLSFSMLWFLFQTGRSFLAALVSFSFSPLWSFGFCLSFHPLFLSYLICFPPAPAHFPTPPGSHPPSCWDHASPQNIVLIGLRMTFPLSCRRWPDHLLSTFCHSKSMNRQILEKEAAFDPTCPWPAGLVLRSTRGPWLSLSRWSILRWGFCPPCNCWAHRHVLHTV